MRKTNPISIPNEIVATILSFLEFKKYLACRLISTTWNNIVLAANEGITMTIKREIKEEEWLYDGGDEQENDAIYRFNNNRAGFKSIDWNKIAKKCTTLELVNFKDGCVNNICDSGKQLKKLSIVGDMCFEYLICIIAVRKPSIMEIDRMDILSLNIDDDETIEFDRLYIIGPKEDKCYWIKPCTDSKIKIEVLVLKNINFSVVHDGRDDDYNGRDDHDREDDEYGQDDDGQDEVTSYNDDTMYDAHSDIKTMHVDKGLKVDCLIVVDFDR